VSGKRRIGMAGANKCGYFLSSPFKNYLIMLQLAHKKPDVYVIALNLVKEVYELTKE
jgi:hypothetical protein